eukprot:1272560-Alexandrium_andersonii.AAC.1
MPVPLSREHCAIVLSVVPYASPPPGCGCLPAPAGSVRCTRGASLICLFPGARRWRDGSRRPDGL